MRQQENLDKPTNKFVNLSTMADASNEALRDFLVSRRSELRITQDQLAKSSGVPRGTIGSIEAGNLKGSPSIQTIEKLAKGLRVPMDDLIRIARGEEPKGVTEPPTPGQLFQVIEGLQKRYEPTDDEWKVIEELDRIGVWHSEFTNLSFWEIPTEERESDFFYLKGLIKEYRRRHGKQGDSR